MNAKLLDIHERLMAIVREQTRILGAWYFGSASRDLADEYSDLDVVFLVDSAGFEEVAARMGDWLKACCDRVILCYPEGFNGEAIVNNGYLLEADGQIVCYDVFLLNSDRLEDDICRMHYTGLQESSIIFDREGRVRALAAAAPSGSPWRDDIGRLTSVYWYHAHLSGKYLMRGDFFKLENVTRALMDAHVSLLLTVYDQLPWGGSANKLRYLSNDAQEHVRHYGCVPDFPLMRSRLLQCFHWFAEDVRAVSPTDTTADAVLSCWMEQTRSLA